MDAGHQAQWQREVTGQALDWFGGMGPYNQSNFFFDFLMQQWLIMNSL